MSRALIRIDDDILTRAIEGGRQARCLQELLLARDALLAGGEFQLTVESDADRGRFDVIGRPAARAEDERLAWETLTPVLVLALDKLIDRTRDLFDPYLRQRYVGPLPRPLPPFTLEQVDAAVGLYFNGFRNLPAEPVEKPADDHATHVALQADATAAEACGKPGPNGMPCMSLPGHPGDCGGVPF